MHRSRLFAPVAVLVTLLAAGCTGAEPAVPGPSPAASDPGAGTTAPTGPDAPSPVAALPEVVASGLAAPWALAFLPDGSALVTVRDTGEVLRVRRGGEPVSVGVVPGVAHGGEGGLLGIAVSPSFEEDRAVFVYLTTASDNRVLRMRLDGEILVEESVVLEGIPRAGNHNGGRIAFGPDGYLYAATGDAADPRSAQDLDSLAGKILRVTADGAPAAGNPVATSPVWSWGHRNVQGLAWDGDGRLFASELGQNAWDELNVIEPGANYGWPSVEGEGENERFVDPVLVWRPSDASPSGIAVAGDTVYVAALRGESLWSVPLTGDGVGEPERLLAGEYGRLRAVEVDGDGNLWILTTNTTRGRVRPGDDQVVVLDPASLG